MATVVVFLTFLSTAFAGPKAGLYGYYIHDAFHVTADTKCVDVPFRVTYSPVGTCLVLTGGSSVLYSFDPADYSVWQSYYVSNEVCAGASSDTVVSAITPTCVGGGSYYQTGNFFSTKLPTFSGPGYLNAYYGSTGCYDATGVGPAYFVYTSGQASSGEYSPTRFTTLSCSLYSGFSPLLTSYFSTAIASPTHYNGGAEALTGSVEVTQYPSATCADTPTSTTTVPLNSCETDGTCVSQPAYLSASCLPPVCLLSAYLSAYLPTCLPAYLPASCLPVSVSICLSYLSI